VCSDHQEPISEQPVAPKHAQDGGYKARNPLNLHGAAHPGLFRKPLAKTAKTLFRGVLPFLKPLEDLFGFGTLRTEALSVSGAVSRPKKVFPAF
jgi:hypothetical protein